MAISYEQLSINIDFGTEYLTQNVAYFLGGIIASNEYAIKNGKKYWISPTRYNYGYASPSEIESHFEHVKTIGKDLHCNTYMSETIRISHLDSGKFRLPGFGTFFLATDTEPLETQLPQIEIALNNSSPEVKRCFWVGVFDGRGSVDIDKKTHNLRQIALDCPSEEIGDFLSKQIKHIGLRYNYNTSRDRVEGGNPRKDQFRVPDVELFMKKVGLITDKRTKIIYDAEKAINSSRKIIDNSSILDGLKTIE